MKNSERITIRVTPEQLQFLKLLEEETKMNKSEIIRYLLQKTIKNTNY